MFLAKKVLKGSWFKEEKTLSKEPGIIRDSVESRPIIGVQQVLSMADNQRIFKGDTHNFGRSVKQVSYQWLTKPRPVIWEHMFLDPRSKLRTIFREMGCFQFLPDLYIEPEHHFFREAKTEYLELSPAPCDGSIEARTSEIGEAVGGLLAISCWFGMHDLHHENVVFGFKGNKLVIAPIDLECVMAKIFLPTDTSLLTKDNSRMGVSGLSFLGKIQLNDTIIPSVCYGYLQSLKALRKYRDRIIEVLSSYESVGKLYTRVVLRSTICYNNAMARKNVSTEIPFQAAERLQLDRGDIPYFFRAIDSSDILFFYGEDEVRKVECGGAFESKKNKFRLHYEISEDEILFWSKAGILQVARRLSDFLPVHGELDFETKYNDLSVRQRENQLSIEFEEIRIREKLSSSISILELGD